MKMRIKEHGSKLNQSSFLQSLSFPRRRESGRINRAFSKQDIKSIFSRAIMVLLSLLFMSTPLAIANPTNVETVTPQNKDHRQQWEMLQTARGDFFYHSAPIDSNLEIRNARERLLYESRDISYARVQMALARLVVEKPTDHPWAEEALMAQAKGSMFKTTPLYQGIQLYLWESFKSAHPTNRKHIFKILKSIPPYHLHIDLEKKLVNAKKPEFKEPARHLLGYEIDSITHHQLNLIQEIQRLSKQVPFPRKVIKELKEELRIDLSGKMYSRLVQRLLVRWLNQPKLRSIAEEFLKNQTRLLTATQMDIWDIAKKNRSGASSSARQILRMTPVLDFEVGSQIRLVAQRDIRPEVRQRAKIILSGHQGSATCPSAFL